MSDESTPRRVAIVTGAASGVGAACARMLARQGHDLVLSVNRSLDLAREVEQECRELGAAVSVVQGDLASDAVCRALAAQAQQRFGQVDALVFAAGVTRFVPIGDLDGVSPQDFHDIFALNTVAPFQLARAAAPHMRAGGAMVMVSSIASQSGNGSSLPYVASKGALNALTLGLARALAPTVRVNAVLPGLIEGRWMRDGLGEEAYERVKAQYAQSSLLGRVSTPEQIARAIAWLLDPNCLMTGQLMVVDAGFSLGKPPAAAGAAR